MQKIFSNKIFLIVSGCIVLFIGLFVAWSLTSKKQPPKIIPITITKNDTIKGAQKPKITIVEYSDFECPTCAYFGPIVSNIVEENKKDTQLVYRHFPLPGHTNAKTAALVAEAAGKQNKFWDMHTLLFNNQTDWVNAKNKEKIFESYAKDLNLNISQYTKDIKSKTLLKKIEDNINQATSYSLQGTPTFIINGRIIDLPQSKEEFEKVIREERQKYSK